MKKCEDLMTIDLRVISSDASALEASRIMRDNSIGFLPVCDPADGRLVAVVTDRDLVTRMCAEDVRPSEARVAEVATTSPAVCQPDDPLDTAEFVMTSLDVSRVVIVDEDTRPIGVLSLTDLIMNERGPRALRTARGVLEREAAGPQPPSEDIVLTASNPNAALPATAQLPVGEAYEASGTAQSRADYIAGGRERRAFKEFPG